MEGEKAIRIHCENFKKQLDLRMKKAKDYADPFDIHRNFKAVAKACEAFQVDPTKPAGTCMVYILLKIDRICNLVFKKGLKAENETVHDSIMDLAIYVEILDEILRDQK